MGLARLPGLQSGTHAQRNHLKSVGKNITRMRFAAKYVQNSSPRISAILNHFCPGTGQNRIHLRCLGWWNEHLVWFQDVWWDIVMPKVCIFSLTRPSFETFPLCFLEVWLMNCSLYWVSSCILALQSLGHGNSEMMKSCYGKNPFDMLLGAFQPVAPSGPVRADGIAESPCKSTGAALMFHNCLVIFTCFPGRQGKAWVKQNHSHASVKSWKFASDVPRCTHTFMPEAY